MTNKWLKYLRRIFAVAFGGIILFYFLDIWGILPDQFHAIAHIQVVPAVISGMIGMVIVLFFLTLIFGRIYCSVICPMGIMQDVFLRFKKWHYTARKNKKKLYTAYSKPLNILRYPVLAVVTVPLLLGSALPLGLLDPYSNFGRIATSLFRPLVAWINNLAADILNAVNNYSLYRVTIDTTTWVVVAVSAVVFIAVFIAVWLRERIVCNTVCPVGSLLGLISRYSLFRVTLNDKCTHCKQCERSCKARCIDSENVKVDKSRCVVCFNCLDKCKFEAVSYAPTGWRLEAKPAEGEKFALTASGIARRRFIKGSALTLAALAVYKLGASEESATGDTYYQKEKHLPMPPGARSREHFLGRCTACQLCISRCPTQVLQPAFMEHGLGGMMMPVMKFRVNSFCNYECKICSDVCPNGALLPMTVEDKKLTRVGDVKLFLEHCVVYQDHQDCGACAEHCPTQAVHMVPFGDTGLTIPAINPEICIGCGGCQSICPQHPAAIRIEGTTIQVRATAPQRDIIDAEINDFGF